MISLMFCWKNKEIGVLRCLRFSSYLVLSCKNEIKSLRTSFSFRVSESSRVLDLTHGEPEGPSLSLSASLDVSTCQVHRGSKKLVKLWDYRLGDRFLGDDLVGRIEWLGR